MNEPAEDWMLARPARDRRRDGAECCCAPASRCGDWAEEVLVASPPVRSGEPASVSAWDLFGDVLRERAGPEWEPPTVDLPWGAPGRFRAVPVPWDELQDPFGQGVLGPYARECPHPDEVDDEDVAVFAVYGHLVAEPIGTANPPREWLVVFLHGVGGLTVDVTQTIAAFARAGFPSIALSWDNGAQTAREVCSFEVDDAAYNDCLVRTREERLEGVTASLVGVLEDLGGVWADYLSGGAPDWRRIILGGHSEGAHEVAFALRRLSVRGAILMSGGGDLGTLSGDPGVLADWMTRRAVDPHVVGLRHEDEDYSYDSGWDLSGMPTDEVPDVQSIEDYYGGYQDAHRLVRTDEIQNPHGSTIDVAMRESHMYLVCTAATG